MAGPWLPDDTWREVMEEVKLKHSSNAEGQMLTLDKILYTEEEIADWLFRQSELDAKTQNQRVGGQQQLEARRQGLATRPLTACS